MGPLALMLTLLLLCPPTTYADLPGTTRVSVNSDWNESSNHRYTSSTSADGRHVAFESEATNLVTSDTSGLIDIFPQELRFPATQYLGTQLVLAAGFRSRPGPWQHFRHDLGIGRRCESSAFRCRSPLSWTGYPEPSMLSSFSGSLREEVVEVTDSDATPHET